MDRKVEKKEAQKRNWVSIYFLSAVSFFNDIASEMLYPLIPIFIKSILGLGAEIIGTVEGIAESINSFLKLLSGWISDKSKKRKIFVLIGYSLSNLARPLIGMANSWGILLGFRLADRVGKGIRTAPRDAMICDLAPKDKRGFAFGIQRGMDHAGAVIGPIIASVLMTLFLLDLKHIFLLSYIPGIITILLVAFGVREIKKKDSERLEECVHEKQDKRNPDSTEKESMIHFRDFKKLGGRFNYFLSILIIFALGNSTDAFLLLRASDSGISLAFIPLLWSALHISKTVFSIFGGYLSDKTGRKIMISLGWGVYLLTYLGFAFTNKSWHIWALFVFYGIFFGFTEGIEKALVGDMVKKETRGLAYGFYNFAIGIAALPASIIFGLVWKLYGFRLAFIMGAFFSLLALVMLVFLRVPQKDEE